MGWLAALELSPLMDLIAFCFSGEFVRVHLRICISCYTNVLITMMQKLPAGVCNATFGICVKERLQFA